jgi:hypothetical protein
MDKAKIHQSPEEQLAISSQNALTKHDETRQAIQHLHQTLANRPTGISEIKEISSVLERNIANLMDVVEHPESLIRKVDEVKSANLITNKELRKIALNTEKERNGQGIEIIRVVGPQGEHGEKGERGEKGDKGDFVIGPVGPKGDDSIVPGPVGPQGIQGIKGDQGPKGSDGLNGRDADIAELKPEEIVEKVETLPFHFDYYKLRNLPELYDPSKSPVGIGGGANALKIVNNGVSVTDYVTTLDFSGSATYSNNGKVTISGGGVTSVSNVDGTLTISPTTGAVISKVNQGKAFIWTALHTFNGGIDLNNNNLSNVNTLTTTNLSSWAGSSITLNSNISVSGTKNITGVGSLSTNILFPNTDSTTALQIMKADGSTNVATFDTTNTRMGLGVTTPSYSLDVSGNSAAGLVGARFTNTNGVNGGVSIYTNGQYAQFINNAGALYFTNNAASADIIFRTDGGTERARFQAGTGNIGFNIASPQFPVSFGPTITLKKLAVYDNGTGTGFYGFGLQAGFMVATANDVQTAYFSTNVGGSLGIHNSNPQAFLDIGGSVATGTISSEDEFYITRGTQGGVSFPQMAGFSLGRWKLPSAFEPFSRLDIKLKAAVNSTLVPDITVMSLQDNGLVVIGNTLATAYMDLAASTTAAASLRMRHGAAPTTPNDGEVWTTTTGMFVRINGVTKTVTLT